MDVARRLVLGIGTGRCGTHTLAEFLNRQPDTLVTHEQPPLLAWKQTPGRDVIGARLGRILRTRPQQLVGDVASFYLPYIEEALAQHPGMKVVCLERPRQEVAASFCALLDAACPLPTDHWSLEPAVGWHHEPVWSRTFPQYPTTSREEGVLRYWDDYHAQVTVLARRFPNNVRVFQMGAALNTEAGMRDLLTFVGIPPEQQVLSPNSRQASAAALPVHQRRAALSAAGPNDPIRCAVLVPYNEHIVPACEASLRELEKRGYTVHRTADSSRPIPTVNQMATDALTEGFEETMWIGPDLSFHPDDVERLRAHRLPIVSGLYPEVGEMALSSHVLPQTRHLLFGAAGGVVEIRHAPGGFLLVRRQVYMEMIRRLALPLCNEHLGRPIIPFFQTGVIENDEGSWLLEPHHTFCERARQCGYSVMADSTIRLWRLGPYPYSWENAGLSTTRYDSFHLNLG